jgi:hypothetical protein
MDKNIGRKFVQSGQPDIPALHSSIFAKWLAGIVFTKHITQMIASRYSILGVILLVKMDCEQGRYVTKIG